MKLSNNQISFMMELKKKGPNVRLVDLDGSYTVGTVTSVTGYEWAIVDRGTPNNRGGDTHEYKYTLTDLGESKLPTIQTLQNRADDAAGNSGYAVGCLVSQTKRLEEITMSDANMESVREQAFKTLKIAKDVVKSVNQAIAAEELYESNR